MHGLAEVPASDLLLSLGPIGVRIAGGLFVLLVSWLLALALRRWYDQASARVPADVNLRVLIGRGLYLGVLLYGLVLGLVVAGVSPATLVTVLGVLGLAASLALQDILKNFCAGVYLLFERPFRIGDEIRVRDFQGRVIDVGIRTTLLRTPEGLRILIPNAVMLSEVVVNRSTERTPGADTPTPPAPGP
jgi:small conductance mechanosensitive channel